ncbi:XRE family transcriptional regulator [Megamonas rupellensis]|uniref:XRE family transcriptional regulator n=1 Tax=Megamonas rupellensis TaxID=491921 RepID=A0A411ZWA1_9FIRM|nr:helix-turn-helix transcriptional regulator [Megamonas rupellensis]RGQ07087.1 XRE family transcriptional regulator [Megamonas rupellensis]
MSFQENLRYYREKAGYKQAKDFAKVLDVPYPTYVGYESQGREPKYNTLCKIADILQVSTDDLLGRTTNILGKNEDERLKQTLNKILSNIDYLYLNVKNIDKDVVYFDIGFVRYIYSDKPIEGLDDYIIDTVKKMGKDNLMFIYDKKRKIDIFDTISINKKDVISFINNGKKFAEELEQINIANSLISRIIKTINLQFDMTINENKKDFSQYKKSVNKNQEKDFNSFFEKVNILTDYWIDKKNKIDELWEIYQKHRTNIHIEYKANSYK